MTMVRENPREATLQENVRLIWARKRPWNQHPKGRKRRYNYTQVVQMLADGYNIPRIASTCKGTSKGLFRVLATMRKHYGLRTTNQLVAHYLRNGWID